MAKIICPHCLKYQLPFKEQLILSNWQPLACPECEGAYVVSPRSTVYRIGFYVMGIFAVAAFSWSGLSGAGFWVAVLIALVLAEWLSLNVVELIKYRDFVAYGKRPLWANIVIFFLLPVVIVFGLFFLVVVYV